MPRSDNYPDDMRQYDNDPRSPEYMGDDDDGLERGDEPGDRDVVIEEYSNLLVDEMDIKSLITFATNTIKDVVNLLSDKELLDEIECKGFIYMESYEDFKRDTENKL